MAHFASNTNKMYNNIKPILKNKYTPKFVWFGQRRAPEYCSKVATVAPSSGAIIYALIKFVVSYVAVRKHDTIM